MHATLFHIARTLKRKMFSLDQIMHSIVIMWPWLPLITMLLFSSLLFLLTKKMKLNVIVNHPPTPPKLPFLGHLHLITSLPHRSFRHLSRKYGPVMLLKLGSIPTVVISSATAAKEVLKVHDLASCTRPCSTANAKFSYNYLDIGLAPYGDHWREVRKICVLELFSARRVQSFQKVREEEIGVMLNSISQSSLLSNDPIDLSEKFYSLTANMITRIAFGKRFRGSELDNENFQKVIRRAMAAVGGFSAADCFPKVGWIIDLVSGVHRRLEMSFNELDAFLQHIVDDRINFRRESCFSHNDDDDDDDEYEENIVDVLLKMEKNSSQFGEVKLTRDCIKALIMDIFLAGVETGATTLVWTMTELIKNPKVMEKLQNEIRNCVKEDKIVKESDLQNLEYLKAVIKEVLRLHTPAPLLLPREAMSHFKVNGYDILPKTHIHVNVWAIGRDPEIWTNPEEFIPERFIGSNIDYKGQNFELLPFGSGRRICPGMNMASFTVELALANVLLCFDWKLPNGMKEEDVDMEEETGVAVAKKSPLQIVPVHYFNSKE